MLRSGIEFCGSVESCEGGPAERSWNVRCNANESVGNRVDMQMREVRNYVGAHAGLDGKSSSEVAGIMIDGQMANGNSECGAEKGTGRETEIGGSECYAFGRRCQVDNEILMITGYAWAIIYYSLFLGKSCL